MTAECERILLERIKDGEYGLYREFVLAYQDKLYAFVLGLVKNEADASDICQEAFFKSYKNLGSFKQKARFSTWLYRIAYTTSMTYLKKKNRQEEAVFPVESIAEIPTRGNDTQLEEEELAGMIQAALQSLRDEYRVALQLWYDNQHTYHEIALTMGIPINTVKSHIRRGKELLKTILQEKYHIEEYMEG